MQHEDHHPDQGQCAGEHLVGAPSHDAIKGVHIGIRSRDDSSLMGPIKITQRQSLDMLEDGDAEIVDRVLADADGAFDLRHRQAPADHQIGQVNNAHDKDSSLSFHRGREVREEPIDAELDKFRAEQLRDGRQQGEDEIPDEHFAVGRDEGGQANEHRPAHAPPRKRFLKLDVSGISHF